MQSWDRFHHKMLPTNMFSIQHNAFQCVHAIQCRSGDEEDVIVLFRISEAFPPNSESPDAADAEQLSSSDARDSIDHGKDLRPGKERPMRHLTDHHQCEPLPRPARAPTIRPKLWPALARLSNNAVFFHLLVFVFSPRVSNI